MHVGHCRGAVVGDALANLLGFVGYDVTKEYYINDAGSQIDVLARSVFLRYREALGEQVGDIPAGLYPGDYLVPVGEELARRSSAPSFAACRKTNGCRSSRTLHRRDDGDDPRGFGCAERPMHDFFFSERTLHANGAALITHGDQRP